MEEKNEIKLEIKLEDKNEPEILKVLLVGKKGVGKTAIKSIIFDNLEPQETLNFAPTEEIEETHVNFINNLYIDVLDFGSNESNIKQSLSTKKELFFSNVGILIYILDAKEEKNDDDLKLFEE
jgi:Ras-related GTP-binding protein A/B